MSYLPCEQCGGPTKHGDHVEFTVKQTCESEHGVDAVAWVQIALHVEDCYEAWRTVNDVRSSFSN